MSDDSINVKLGVQAQGLTDGMKHAQEGLEQAVAGMKGDLGALSEAFGKLGIAAVGVAAVGLAFEAIKESVAWCKEAVKETLELGESFEGLKAKTGMSSESFLELDTNMKMQGKSIGDLDGLIAKLGRTIANNSDTVAKYVADGDKAKLAQMSYKEMLISVGEKLVESTNYTEKAQLAIGLFGRAGLTAIPMLEKLAENQEAASATAKMMGISMDEVADGANEFERGAGQVEAMMMAIKLTIGKELLPVIEELVKWLKNYLPEALEFLRNVMTGTRIIWIESKTEVQNWITVLEVGAHTAMSAMIGIKDVAKKALTGDLKGALDTASGGWKKLVKDTTEYGREMVARTKESERQIATIMANRLVQAGAGAHSGKDAGVGSGEGSGEGGSLLGAGLFGSLVDADRDYEAAKALMKSYEKDSEEAIKYLTGLTREQSEAGIQAANDDYELKKSNLEALVISGRITEDQMLEHLKEAEGQKYEVIRANQMRIEGLYDKGSIEYAKELSKEKQLTRKHYLDRAQIEKQQLQASSKGWTLWFDGLTSGFSSVIKGLVKGTMSWGDAFRTVLSNMLDFAIETFTKMILDYIKNILLAQTTHTAASTTAVAENSAEAGTGAMSSAAKIPFYGWAIAIGAGLAVFAAAKSMSSAAGGWDRVPSDQMAMIHKNEMVLPASLAEGVRNKLGDGSSGSGGLTMNIHALDGASVKRVFQQKSNQKTLMRMIQQASRKGRL